MSDSMPLADDPKPTETDIDARFVFHPDTMKTEITVKSEHVTITMNFSEAASPEEVSVMFGEFPGIVHKLFDGANEKLLEGLRDGS